MHQQRWGALKNLDENGNAQVYGNAQVHGDARVYGSAGVYGNAQVHGDARVYGNAQVYGSARVYSNAQVHGDARVYGSAWEFSPLQIQGTRHFVNCGSHTAIQIGCYRQTAKEWEKSFEQVGNENGYTAGQIEEYKIYIDVCKKWLALHRADFKRMNANVAEAK